jgi:type VI secretion system protein ImpM
VAFWSRKKQEGQSGAIHATGAFGKLPNLGDFVRVGAVATSPSFEAWLEAGMGWGDSRRQDWQARYVGGKIHAFVFKGAEGHLTTGVIKPSRDRVDRKFPLVVFAQLPERLPAAPHLLPLFLGNFLDAGTQILIDAESFTTSAELASRITNLPPIEFDGFAHDYYTWARQTSVASVCPALYGDQPIEKGVAALAACFDDVLDAIGPGRGQESPTTSLGVRLPLGAGGSASATFWLDAVRRAARWTKYVPSCFWSFDGNSGSMLVQLGKTPPSSLAELWAPDPDSESICDLVTPKAASSHRMSTVGSRNVRGDASIADVLDALERG